MNFKGVRTGGSGPMLSGIVAAAQYVAYGAFVDRSADGKIKMVNNVDTTPTHSYLGVANDDIVKHTYEGFYDPGGKVPIVVSGIVNAWLLGGEVVLSGDHLKFPAMIGAGTENVGVLTPESTLTRTVASVARYVGQDDAGDANFDQTVSAISAEELTIDSAQHLIDLDLSEGDMVAVISTQGGEMNIIDDPASASTKCTLVKPLAITHSAAIKIYKLEQIAVMLE